MVSRKLVQRTNTWLNRVEFFYIYSWVNGLCFGYFQFFLALYARSKLTLKTPPSAYVVTFIPYGISLGEFNVDIILSTKGFWNAFRNYYQFMTRMSFRRDVKNQTNQRLYCNRTILKTQKETHYQRLIKNSTIK